MQKQMARAQEKIVIANNSIWPLSIITFVDSITKQP
jgi:hypothetical protein